MASSVTKVEGNRGKEINTITVETTINAPIEKVWEYWNEPEHITGWAFTSDDWEAPAAENELRVGGKFKTTMAAKDKSAGFLGIPRVLMAEQLRACYRLE